MVGAVGSKGENYTKRFWSHGSTGFLALLVHKEQLFEEPLIEDIPFMFVFPATLDHPRVCSGSL